MLVQRVSYHFSDPEIGDIVVFHPPKGADANESAAPPMEPGQACDDAGPDEADETNFIKRVVATPGDTLYIEDGHAIVNGEPIEDDFIKPCGASAGAATCRNRSRSRPITTS